MRYRVEQERQTKRSLQWFSSSFHLAFLETPTSLSALFQNEKHSKRKVPIQGTQSLFHGLEKPPKSHGAQAPLMEPSAQRVKQNIHRFLLNNPESGEHLQEFLSPYLKDQG